MVDRWIVLESVVLKSWNNIAFFVNNLILLKISQFVLPHKKLLEVLVTQPIIVTNAFKHPALWNTVWTLFQRASEFDLVRYASAIENKWLSWHLVLVLRLASLEYFMCRITLWGAPSNSSRFKLRSWWRYVFLFWIKVLQFKRFGRPQDLGRVRVNPSTTLRAVSSGISYWLDLLGGYFRKRLHRLGQSQVFTFWDIIFILGVLL